MAEFMGKTLEYFCAGAEVENAGIGGTTADQWALYTSDVISDCGEPNWDVVYISIGGNDLLESGCTMEKSVLQSKIQNGITNIVNNIATGASKYVVTGYCMPYASEDDTDDGCNEPSDFFVLSEVMQDLSVSMPGGTTLEVIDSLEVCGGSSDSFSSEFYFQDPIHLNGNGYCAVFSQSPVQVALSCRNNTEIIDCETSGIEIFGLDDNCVSSSDASCMTTCIYCSLLLLVLFFSLN